MKSLVLQNTVLISLRINSGVLNFFNGIFGSEDPFDPEIIPAFPMVTDILRVYPTVLSSIPYWLYSLVIIVIAMFPDVVIRVFRKHFFVIKTELKFAKGRLFKKFNQGSFEPNKQQTYYNPVYNECENGIIGKRISERKSSTASSILC